MKRQKKEEKQIPKNVDNIKYHLEKNEELYEQVNSFFSQFKSDDLAGGFRVLKNIVDLAAVLSKIRAEGINGAYKMNQLTIEDKKADQDTEMLRKIMTSINSNDFAKKFNLNTNKSNGKSQLDEIMRNEIESGNIKLTEFDEQSINNFHNHQRSEEDE